MEYLDGVYVDQETGQRFTVNERRDKTLIVYDHGADARREVNRILWEMDVEAGRLRPERREA